MRGLATKLSEPTRAPFSHVTVFRFVAFADTLLSISVSESRPMFNLDCPICLNSFSFEHIRSLPCGMSLRRASVYCFTQRCRFCHLGHTYCSSCVEKLIDDIDETSTCPECRNDFEFEDIRPLYLKPSNNSSGSQTSSRHDSTSASDQDGYIKQAKHIARRLQRLNTKSPAESVKNAADVIEQVATVQCKEAQACPLT